MSKFSVSNFSQEDIQIHAKEIEGGAELEFVGEISMPDPSDILFSYMTQVHQQAMEHGFSEVRLDFTKLEYLNSAGILLFLKWIKMIQDASPELRYTLHIVYAGERDWQRVGIVTVAKMAAGVVKTTKT
ncbi:MAG: hypothetical protein JSV08_00265 [Acidobacteriota bacterium]|nr:MAG: hypothetical protein JSV08_00265 [Acidobacteriota bacterium]